MKVTITKTSPLTPRGNFVQWTLSECAPDRYLFDLYRSGSRNGPWEKVVEGLVDTYSFIDRFEQLPGTSPATALRPNQLSQLTNFHYQVTARNASGLLVTDTTEVGPTLAPKQRQELRALTHAQWRGFRYNGVPVALLKRRKWGVRCKKCIDPITKEVLRSACTSCWGTGFESGYWAPVLTYARRAPMQETSQVTPEGKTNISNTRMVLLAIPRMEQGDLVVFLQDNKRFFVDQQVETQLRTVPVHQVVLLTEISGSDIVYRIPVDPRTVPSLL